jgi:hypothetical protein
MRRHLSRLVRCDAASRSSSPVPSDR